MGGALYSFPMKRHLKSMNLALNVPMTEFRQPIQVQSHLEMPGILVQQGRIQCT